VDNHERRVRYVMARAGVSEPDATLRVHDAYLLGDADTLLLTPRQRRRVRHKRGLAMNGRGVFASPHRGRQRGKARDRLLRRLARGGAGLTEGSPDG
jgi:hypothetical protein